MRCRVVGMLSLFVIACLLMQFCLSLAPCSSSVLASSREPCFSEYVKESGNNKALESAPGSSSGTTQIVDVTAPTIVVSSPSNGSTVSIKWVTVSGTVTDDVGVAKVLVSFSPADILPDGSFTGGCPVVEGANTVKITAIDTAGNTSTVTINITYVPPAQTTTVLVLTVGSDVVTVDGKSTTIDAPPEIVSSRTFVPIRFIAETFGADVEWFASYQGISITLADIIIGLQINNRTLVINGAVGQQLDAAPYIRNGRTMVPLRAISEVFRADVVWDPPTRTITITYIH